MGAVSSAKRSLIRAAPRGLVTAMARAIVLDAADGGLAVACALRRRGVPVTVVAVPGYRWVTRARGIDGRIATTRAEWLAELDDLASLGRGVLIPASDRAVEFVARERNRIPPDLYSFEGPSSAHLELTDGVAVPVGSAGRSAGACGATPLQSRRARCRRCVRRLSFAAQAGAITPVPRPVRNPPQYSRHNPDDLRAAAVPALDAGLEWLVTEFIPGPETPRRGGHDPPGGWLVVTRLHPAQAATVSALLRGGIGDGGGAFAGRDGDGPTAAGCCRIRQHLQLRGQAPRGDR